MSGEPRTVKFDELPARTRRLLFQTLTTVRTKDYDRRIITLEVATVLRGLWKVTLVAGLLGAFLTTRFVVSRIIEYKIGSDPLTFVMMGASVAAIVASLLQALIIQRYPPAPWTLGHYLFAGHVVNADDGWLDLTPTIPLGKPTLVTVKRDGQYTHSRLDLLGQKLSFSFAKHERAEAVTAEFLERRARYAAAIDAQDLAAAEAEDPFAECAITGTWTAPGEAAEVPSVAARPRNLKLRLIISGVVGAAVGIGAFVLVNVLRVGMS